MAAVCRLERRPRLANAYLERGVGRVRVRQIAAPAQMTGFPRLALAEPTGLCISLLPIDRAHERPQRRRRKDDANPERYP
jgi:hypothetical protein